MELRLAAPEAIEGGARLAPGSWTSGFPSPNNRDPCAHALKAIGGVVSARWRVEPSGDCSASSWSVLVRGVYWSTFPRSTWAQLGRSLVLNRDPGRGGACGTPRSNWVDR